MNEGDDFPEERYLDEYEYIDEDGNPISSSQMNDYEVIDELEYPQEKSYDSTKESQEETKSLEAYRPENIEQTEEIQNFSYEPKKEDLQGVYEIKPQVFTEIENHHVIQAENIEKEKTIQELDTNYLIEQARITQESFNETKKDIFDENANEDLLRKLTMPTKSQPVEIVKNNENEETKKDPYIYQQGHPHLGTTFTMDTISDLARNLFSNPSSKKDSKTKN